MNNKAGRDSGRGLTEEGTGGEDGGDEGLLAGGDHVTGGVVGEVGGGLTKETEEVLHGGDTRDGTGVVSEEDTGKGGEADHENASGFVLGGIGTEARTRCSGTTSHDEGALLWKMQKSVVGSDVGKNRKEKAGGGGEGFYRTEG